MISTSGGSFDIFRLTDCVVSPCRISMVKPSFCAYRVILLNTSLFRARNGVMYSAFILPVFFDSFISVNIGITEHSVFPEPVGAITNESCF